MEFYASYDYSNTSRSSCCHACKRSMRTALISRDFGNKKKDFCSMKCYSSTSSSSSSPSLPLSNSKPLISTTSPLKNQRNFNNNNNSNNNNNIITTKDI
ncbi:hypothetical protein DFA_01071 [Cavenderia fasciculata]|uniref:Uncharacterized protein n=1 Tax=Cavenderia fasciculata TaxID=261658 RepID=F4PQM9_CACFS|nr:uncharacterized protein DFA_01071 [Cavenderia fasciculata]EGG21196.1 hypothetical protein DFA_01071 [Cavenderia fasciculata]|eukprot:XP_004359046.1 hypothetical protein DFA_01071 [Cavenderia fasciculata]